MAENKLIQEKIETGLKHVCTNQTRPNKDNFSRLKMTFFSKILFWCLKNEKKFKIKIIFEVIPLQAKRVGR